MSARFAFKWTLPFGFVFGFVLWMAGWASAQRENETLPSEHPAIQYDKAEVLDRVSRLEQELQSGRVKLEKREGQTGYLPSLLKALQINADSQALVFSKTSFQAAKISP